MVRRVTHTMPERLSEINMTPLIDLTFLLLITFVITFPLIEQGIPVNLPRARAQELSPDKSRKLTVGLQGDLHLDDTPVTKEELTVRMRALAESDPGTVVLVRADEGIKYGKLVSVLKILHDAKITKMALVTQAVDQPQP